MKKEGKLIGFLIVLLMLSVVFSGCVTQKSTITVTQDPNPPPSPGTSPSTQGTTPQTGSPYILAGMSYDTETVDMNNHIQISVQNYGSATATNLAITISNDYYSNFTLQRVNPNLSVDGNRFYIGTLGAGERLQIDIYLKAKQSGVYTGTISYSYDGLQESGKIKDVTTRVP